VGPSICFTTPRNADGRNGLVIPASAPTALAASGERHGTPDKSRRCRGEDLQPFLAAAGGRHRVALAPEDPDQQVAQHLLVVDYQDVDHRRVAV
jgi:hypothetical protein